MGYRVIFSGRADRDLEAVVRFLAQKNSQAAERLGYAIVDNVLSLDQQPRRGLPVRARAGYRRILHRPYFLIFYCVDEVQKLVEIARVWDARQDPQSFTLD